MQNDALKRLPNTTRPKAQANKIVRQLLAKLPLGKPLSADRLGRLRELLALNQRNAHVSSMAS